MADTVQMGLQILFGDLELQTVHRGIGLDRGRIYRLRMAAHHTLVDTHGKYPCEHFLENILREQLARTADGTVPGKFLIDVIPQKKQNVQPHTAMGHQIPVTDHVLQIAHRTKLEEHHRVDALLAAFPIIPLGQRVQKARSNTAFSRL